MDFDGKILADVWYDYGNICVCMCVCVDVHDGGDYSVVWLYISLCI